jgi:small subunit ribosomal protein S16
METPARLILDLERVDAWLSKGAVQSETVRTLVNRARKGGDTTVAIGELDPEEANQLKAVALEERRKKEAAAAEVAAAEEVAEEAPVEEAAEEAPVEEAAEEAPVEEAAEEAPVEEAAEEPL